MSLKIVENLAGTEPENKGYPLISCHHGNARRLVDKVGDRFCWIEDLSCFAVFDPNRGIWVHDIDEVAMWDLTDEISDDIFKAYGADAQESYLFAQMRAGTIQFCRSAGKRVNSKMFAGNPDLYNVANGTIDLNNGALLPWSASDHLMQRSDVVFPGLDAPEPERYNRFLEEIWRDHPQIPAFWKRVVGFTLTGHVKPAQLFVLHGDGSNGKSTLMTVLKAMHGIDDLTGYAGTAKATLITDPDATNTMDAIAVTYGKRFISYGEPKRKVPLTENIVKDLTGGDLIQAKFLYKRSFSFLPTAKNFLPTNHLPEIEGTDNGIRRRVCLIPFERQWTEDETLVTPDMPLAEKGLEEKLRAELPLILAQSVRACLEFKQYGLGIPEAVSAATKQYIASQDKKGLQSLGWKAFLSSGMVRLDANAPRMRTTKQPELQATYNSWAATNGHPTISATKDMADVARCTSGVTNGSQGGWHGIYINHMDDADRALLASLKG